MLHQVLLLAGLLLCQGLESIRPPVGHKYEVVIPQKLHTQHKRDTQSKYPDVVHYGLELERKPLVLHLQKTEDLISENYTETQYSPDGTPITSSPNVQNHCYYQGYVKNDSDSWASISTCNGISGIIRTRGRRFLIAPLKQSDTEEHAVYPYEALEETPRTCGVTNETYSEDKFSMVARSSSDTEKNQLLKSKKYIELYIVADNSMFVKYNRNSDTLKQRIFEVINFVNVVYKSINTFVALTGIEIWDRRDEFTVTTDPSYDLNQFSKWREETLLPRKSHDNAQLLTNINFDGSTVGLAFVSTMCSNSHSTGVIQDHTPEPIAIGATLAHEMGHNLGMNHDDRFCPCTSESCIMAPSLSYNTPRQFSTCSHQHYQTFILNQMPLCLKNMPQREDTKAPPVCGNTFTEPGEDCDCGTVQECNNPCCEASTCKFKTEAQCSEGECCANCQIKKAGIVCRPAKDNCDLADMCDGVTATCPSDRFRVNGISCMNGQGYCFNGKCPTLQSQCSALWGPGARVDSSCFRHNRRGNNYGHCQVSMGNYQSCAPEDVKCGVLYCSGGDSNPTINGYTFSIGNCKAVANPVIMVQNGTYCEEGKVCYQGKCISTESAYSTAQCKAKCPENAVCDSELQCQCKEGYAPPNCTATRTNNYLVIIIVLIIICFIIFCMVLVAYKKSQRRKERHTQAPVSGVANPTFNIQERGYGQPGSQAPIPQGYQKPANNPPYPPANKPVFPTPPPQGYQRPANNPPYPPANKPVFPTPPPQGLKPQMRN
ncbi:zinc metalloproteinase-disintegrin-like lachestatin-2 [Pelobates fuscus]|uniref:zinc metalloproteinase-disintegrin-like lachestatin-2 n=1 Tax=Pelobates fuscus TaxID=191477 RepID=UPI002FE478F5